MNNLLLLTGLQLLLFSLLASICFSTFIFAFIYPNIHECIVLTNNLGLFTWCILYSIFLLIQILLNFGYQVISIFKKLHLNKLTIIKQPAQVKFILATLPISLFNFIWSWLLFIHYGNYEISDNCEGPYKYNVTLSWIYFVINIILYIVEYIFYKSTNKLTYSIYLSSDTLVMDDMEINLNSN